MHSSSGQNINAKPQNKRLSEDCEVITKVIVVKMDQTNIFMF